MVRQGDLGTEMYFVAQGQLQVRYYSEDTDIALVLNTHQTGEIMHCDPRCAVGRGGTAQGFALVAHSKPADSRLRPTPCRCCSSSWEALPLDSEADFVWLRSDVTPIDRWDSSAVGRSKNWGAAGVPTSPKVTPGAVAEGVSADGVR